jgi:hypothetical protein
MFAQGFIYGKRLPKGPFIKKNVFHKNQIKKNAPRKPIWRIPKIGLDLRKLQALKNLYGPQGRIALQKTFMSERTVSACFSGGWPWRRMAT